MFVSIKYKVFLAILLANVLLASAMFALSIWNFKRGFIDYLNQAEAQKLEPLSQALAREYNEQQGWERLQHERWRWRELVATYILAGKSSRHEEPGETSEDAPPEAAAGRVMDRQDSDGFAPAPGREGHERPGKVPVMLTFNPRIMVLDANRNVVIGRDRDKRLTELRPIRSNGQVIGYLGIQRHRDFTGDLEKVFVDKQQHSLTLIMLGMILLSALMALPLALHLVKPIRQLLDATRCLIAGKFATRITVKQKDELGLLAGDFNYLAKTLEENQAVRQQWIADISHELRTPLAILQGEIEAIQDNIRPMNKASLASLEEEIRQLNALVNDLHDLSVSDLGGLSYKKVAIDIGDIIASVSEAFAHALQKKNISIQLKLLDGILVLADGQRLEQLFNNLMQNTLRYTDDNGQLEIVMQRLKDSVQIRWSDSSPGVMNAQLDKLFDRFYRVENKSRNRRSGGSGLGLAICQNIVKAHNGSIIAGHSALGGVEITITLPVDGANLG